MQISERSRSIALAVAIVFVIGLAWWARSALGIDWSAASVRETIASYGVWGPIVYIGLFAIRAFVLLPAPLLLTVGGIAFGIVPATLYGGIGLMLFTAFIYAAVHALGVEAFARTAPPGLQLALRLARSRAGAVLLALASAYPVAIGPGVQMGAAAAGMPPATYLLAASVGSFGRAAAYAAFGSALVEGQGLLLGSIALLALTLLPLALPRTRAWLREIAEWK
jgi:uncharacterized membrane protein YdjX (TVP38/TMEM64 family)